VNLHVSLLPRWRGSSPIQRAIIGGDTLTGVSLMQMDAGMDTGAVLQYVTQPIYPMDTTQSLQTRLSELSAHLLLDNLDLLEAGRLTPQPQHEEAVSYAAKISKEDALINWELGAIQIDRLVRAFNPWPIAYSFLGQQRLRIWKTHPINELTDAPPGMILGVTREGIDVACGGGIVRIQELQWSGGNVLSTKIALSHHQHPFKVGMMFNNGPVAA
jgi:methionyl-tRNA formyltransferase